MARLNVVGKAHESTSGDDFVWFIYASSLDRDAFAQWAAQHGYALPDLSRAAPAKLPGFRLSFDVESRFWGGAVASLMESPGEAVEGIALPMSGGQRGLVEHKEGAISGLYVPLEVDVAPLDGSPQRRALAFRANPSRRLPSDAPPSPRFLEALLRGARAWKLSPEYIARLEGIR